MEPNKRMLIAEKKVFVGKFKSRNQRIMEMGEQAKQFTNIFIKNIPDSWTEEDFRKNFAEYG